MSRGEEHRGTQTGKMKMDAINNKLATMKTDEIVDVVLALRDTCTSEANAVVDRALAILESRLPADQFIRFCDDLYAAMG